MKLWIIALLLSFSKLYHSQNYQTQIDSLINQFETAFNNLRIVLNTSALSSTFSTIDISPVNENVSISILTASKSDTETLINKVNVAVDKIQSTLTNAFEKYVSPPLINFTFDCNNNSFIPYFRAKAIRNHSFAILNNCNYQSFPFTQDAFLENVLTSRKYSTTHVPTTVFDSSALVQDFVNWTRTIDAVFALNQDDSQMKWQYFCSNSGLFRIYPGIRWKIQAADSDTNNSLIDFFDCRSEQFYLQSTTYPKKVLILLDQSGSMTGKSMFIAKFTVSEILNTLTENDYFNILMYSSNWSFADNTTRDVLIQATDRNKADLLRLMNLRYNADKKAEFSRFFEMGFNLLRKDKNNQTGSNPYNYMIMIVSDGSFIYDESITQNDIAVRIFTYLTLEGSKDRYTVSGIACKNKGFAVESRTLSSVKKDVQNYLNVVSRTNALMGNSFNVWTGVNQMKMQPSEIVPSVDFNSTIATTTTIFSTSMTSTKFSPNTTIAYSTTTFVTVQPIIPVTNSSNITIVQNKPIKLFVAAAKAVYDQRQTTLSMNQGIILGSAGIDISVNEFIKTVPFWKIGVNAYLFAITSSGFLVFHPKFRPQYQTYMKSFYRNVDLSDVEIDSNTNIVSIENNHTASSSNAIQLRTEMLNQAPDKGVKKSISMTTHQIVDDYKTAFTVTRNYFITTIDKTSYKFGLSIPVNQTVPIYSNQKFAIISLNTFQQSFGVDFNSFFSACNVTYFAKTQSGIGIKNHEFCTMSQNISALQLQSPMCTLVKVLTDANLLENCTKNSSDTLIYLNNVYNEIVNTKGFPIFWGNISGLDYKIQQVFSIHHFGTIRYYNYDFLSYQNFITNHSLGIDDPLYQETILTAQHFLNNRILVARPLPNSVFQMKTALASMVFTVTTPLMINETYLGIIGVQVKYDYFSSILMANTLCSKSSVAECYIVTEAGLILFNNLDMGKNGLLLSDVSCALMESLVNNNIFLLQYLYDFQALCQISNVSNFSSKLINPFSFLFHQALWFVYKLFLLMKNLSFSCSLWSFTNQEENPDYNVSSVTSASHCYLKIPTFMAKLPSNQVNGTMKCTSCNVLWFIRTISNTNLMLVISLKPTLNCSCSCSVTFGKKIRLTRNQNNSIANPYTVNPSFYSNFVPFKKIENSTICSSQATFLRRSMILFLTIFLLQIIYLTNRKE